MNQVCEVIFWDVQHGNATYIKTPNNRHIVIDLGTGDYSGNQGSFSPLLHLKNKYNVNQLDCVIITHPHLDHIDDILNFDSLDPKVLLLPRQLTNDSVMEDVLEKDREKFLKYCEINNRYNIPINGDSSESITKPYNWGGLNIKYFSSIGYIHKNFNNYSIITVIEYDSYKIVISGDNEKESMDELMRRTDFISAVKDADILLAPHHGRESGYNSDFIDIVKPQLTIVSDGSICDTSANYRYSKKSSGYPVFKNNGYSTTRYCLTTNSDGEVYVRFGKEIGLNVYIK